MVPPVPPRLSDISWAALRRAEDGAKQVDVDDPPDHLHRRVCEITDVGCNSSIVHKSGDGSELGKS